MAEVRAGADAGRVQTRRTGPGPDLPGSSEEHEAFLEAGRLATLGELVRGAVHEINNPLFATLALLELAVADAEPGSKARDRLRLVQECAAEIKAVVEHLHAFSRTGSAEPATVCLAEAARAAADLVRRTSMQRDVELVERYPAGPALVVGDADRLRLLLVNVLLNAFQAVPGEGTVTLEVALEEAEVVAVVADDGEGFPGEPESAFAPYRTTRGGGGLGLAVGRAIAEAHGGVLAVDEAPARGARVLLRLPVAA